MNTKDMNDILKKFSTLMNNINTEIEKSTIKNNDLKDFKLEFKDGRCVMVCYRDSSGYEVCYCKRD